MVELVGRARRRLDDVLVETFDEERRRFDGLVPGPEELEALAADLRAAAGELRGAAGGRSGGCGRDLRGGATGRALSTPNAK